MSSRALGLYALLMIAASGPACGADPAATDQAAASGPSGGGEASQEDCARLPADATVTAPTDCAARWVASISGRVIDQAGAPVGGATIQVCSGAGCRMPVKSCADGIFGVGMPENFTCTAFTALQVSHKGYASNHYRLKAAESGAVRLKAPVRLFALQPATEAAGVYSLAGGSQLTLGKDRLVLPYGVDGIHSVSLSGADPRPLGAADRFDGMLAFSPEVDVVGEDEGPEANRLRLKVGTAAGAKVNVWIQAGDECRVQKTAISEGEWVPLNQAPLTVDAQGFIELTVPCLGWIGWTAIKG